MQSIVNANKELTGVDDSKYEIHAACRDGRLAVVESLLNANPKLANLKDDDERLPIHWACSHGHIDIVRFLASKRDFDPDVTDGSGWTPLMIAVNLKEGEEIVKLLLSKGADVNEKNNNNQTAIFFAVSKNNRDIVSLLFDSGAGCRTKDKRDQYPIHRAAAIGSRPMIELLLKHRSAVSPADSAGQTPLHHAIAEGHGDAALALLKAGAEADRKDVDGKTPMELAPDKKVSLYIKEAAEQEGIEL